MSDVDDYILDSIRTWVWSGFYSPGQVHRLIEDILEEGADEEMLRASVQPEFDQKKADEATWPETTDCDRLDNAFELLNAQGIIAPHNTGYTMSDGQEDVGDALRQRGEQGIKGSCFYHGQDRDRAINGGGLMLAFGDLNDNATQITEVGAIIASVLQECGLPVDWDGDPKTRLHLPHFDWKQRSTY